MPEIVSIIESKRCYGCEACYNTCGINAISMQKGKDGFLYPVVDISKCVECGKCSQNCPAILKNVEKITENKYQSKVYSARINDLEIRKISSSGGIFTAISDEILNKKGCVVGVVWNEDFSVKHIITVEKSLRNEMRQSKYIQSTMEDCYKLIKEKLAKGQTVLFTGTPCQNAGLKLYLSDLNTKNLVLCDVLCGGNVSPGFFRDYLKYIEKKKADIVTKVCFRTKALGWKQHHIRINLENSIYQGARRDNEPFFHLYLKKYIIRESCFSCNYASINRVTDITLGDFWGIDKVDPQVDDDIGISYISVNTEKGETLLNEIADKITMEERGQDLAIQRQINLKRAPEKPKKYDLFWKEYKRFGAEYVLKKYTVFGVKNKIRFKLKKLLQKWRDNLG